MRIRKMLYSVDLTSPKMKLSIGDTVYKVSRAEVREYEVIAEFYTYDPKTRRYTLYNGESYNTASENDTNVFTDRAEAENAAMDYVRNNTVWLSSDIKTKESRCWEWPRESDEKMLYAWYVLVPDCGILILKNPYSFIHAIDFKDEDKARRYVEKTFIPSVEHKTTWDGQKVDYMTECDISHIEYVNLYPCGRNDEWSWSADGYSGIADEQSKIALARKELEEMKSA